MRVCCYYSNQQVQIEITSLVNLVNMVKIKKAEFPGPLKPKVRKSVRPKVKIQKNNVTIVEVTTQKSSTSFNCPKTEEKAQKEVINISNFMTKRAPNAEYKPIDFKITLENSLKQVQEELASPEESSSSYEEESKISTTKKFKEEKTGEYILHPLEKRGCILILHCNSSISFNGIMQIKVLYGSVDILGKCLKESDGPQKVFSPRGTSFLTMCNKNEEKNKKTQEKNKKPPEIERKHSIKALVKELLSLGLDSTIIKDLIGFKLKNKIAVVYCEDFECKSTEFLEENLAQKLYPPLQNNLRCQFRNYVTQDWNTMKISEEWEPVLSNAVEEKSVVLLSGGKGVGKSTLLRYLTNRLLNSESGKQTGVVIIDLDPGQPEFTIPGCVSFTKITTPLLGPNYTHLKQPETCVFVPYINVQTDHMCYLQSVQKLVQSFKDFDHQGPTLVNYMGFTKGLGLNLVSSVVNMLRPTAVVQIESVNKKSRNFGQDLWPECVQYYSLEEFKSYSDDFNYNFFKIDSIQTNSNQNWLLEPRQVREMCVLAYFSQLLPPNCLYLTDFRVNIYQAQLSSLKVTFKQSPVDCSVANAHLVALTSKNGVLVGWGIVRAIDKMADTIYLLTPVPCEQLHQVDTLSVGSVTLPPSIYLRHHAAIKGHVPYTFKGELSNFARTPKRSMRYA